MQAFKLSDDGRFAIFPDGTKRRYYRPDGETLRSYMADRTSRVKIIQGPQGSGTSSMCCQHIWQQATAQPLFEGKQRFRCHIFRETYPKLEETAIKTWLDWFKPEEYGRFYETKPYLHEIRVGPLELDVIFMAMEDIRDAKAYFDSLETSLMWFNEGQHAQVAVIRHAASRISPPRYPANKDGGCAWGGLLIDTNAPPADHWIPLMRGDVALPDWMTEEEKKAMKKPDNWRFFLQPPGLIEEVTDKGELLGYKPNPNAENLKHLHPPGTDPLGPKNFYMEKVGAQTKSWIDAYVMNRSAVVVDGKPVYPNFRRDVHVSDRHLEPIENLPVTIGVDSSGRSPAALIGQQLRGDWFIQREFIGNDVYMDDFAPQLKKYLAQNYPGYKFVFWGDPAGEQRGAKKDSAPVDIFRANGMTLRPSPDAQNRASLRREAMNAVLQRRSSSPGRGSAMIVDPRCTTFITGMSGGYFFRRVRVSGERYAEEAEKNQYSHVCEAGEYMMLGGGEGRGIVLNGSEPKRPTQTIRPYSPFKQAAGGVRW
jgi:hypothetical protein